MTTDIGEIPLINMANVMLSALKAAAEGPTEPGACIERLVRNLARVHEDAEAQRSAVTERVELAFVELLAAGLIEETGRARFRITARGRTVLEAHPMGVDETVLAEFHEFRDFVKRASLPADDGESVPAAQLDRPYLDGYGAYGAGRRVTDNPHPADTAEHMAWDAGWFEAFDEGLDNASPRTPGPDPSAS
jgi:restriction system protein